MKEQPVNYLKILRPGRKTPFAWDYKTEDWFTLPENRWLPKREPVLCKSGYHFIRNLWDLPGWLSSGAELWVVHTRGTRIDADDKGCVASMKLVQLLDAQPTELKVLSQVGGSFVRKARMYAMKENQRIHRETGVRPYIRYLMPPYLHPEQTKYLRLLNQLMKRNDIITWGDPVWGDSV